MERPINKTFKVGDEVVLKEHESLKLVILKLYDTDNDLAIAFNYKDCTTFPIHRLDRFIKTGRTFPQIAEILELMKEE